MVENLEGEVEVGQSLWPQMKGSKAKRRIYKQSFRREAL